VNLPYLVTRKRLRDFRIVLAEQIARAIEDSACAPGEECVKRFCPDCVRYRQAQADAATARRIGGPS
jgi:hypothetical protein